MVIDISHTLLHTLVKERPVDGHKGTFGHALLVSGSYGMAGACILAGKGCMRSGVGKLTIHTPRLNNDIIQIALPEAIMHHDQDDDVWTSSPEQFSAYKAIGIGPGIGKQEKTAEALHETLIALQEENIPMVMDADALNLLAEHPEWSSLLPENTILTPHPLEYRRLMDAGFDMERLILVLKGHPTSICIPNSTDKYTCPFGNNGMGTAGSGDVLTGIILGLLAQGYTPKDAAILGVSLHAISGDIAASELGEHSLIASDLITYLPKAFKQITK